MWLWLTGDRKRSDEFERENGTSGRAGGPNKFAEQSGVKRSGASKFGSGSEGKPVRITPSTAPRTATSARSSDRPLVSPLSSPRKQDFDPANISKSSSYAARRETWGAPASGGKRPSGDKPAFGSKRPNFGDKPSWGAERPASGSKRPAPGGKRFDQFKETFKEGAPAKSFGAKPFGGERSKAGEGAPASRRTAARDKYFLGERPDKKFGAKEYGEKKFGKERPATPRGPSTRTMSRAGSKPAPVFSGPGTRGAGRNPTSRRTKPSR
ncbi:MAG: hypothetical protein H7222_13200 [Methylotenera sp.]|nr:hypothetical protein [Oligoflexia bacterium]